MLRIALLTLILHTSPVYADHQLEAYVSHSVFYSPGEGPYVENYLVIGSRSFTYVENEDGRLQGSLEITLLYKQDSSIIQFDKYQLKSPAYKNLKDINSNLIDLRRKSLQEGAYRLEVQITDEHNRDNTLSLSQAILISHKKDRLQLSDITLIDTYRKTETTSLYNRNGMEMIPHVINYYPTKTNKLTLYAELYNAPAFFGEDRFLISSSIIIKGSGKLMHNMRRYTKETAAEVNVIFSEFDITDLPTGNYDLLIEVRSNRDSLLTVKKLFFQRSNKRGSESKLEQLESVQVENSFVQGWTQKQIEYCLDCLSPISSRREAELAGKLMDRGDSVQMKRYFLNFWINKNPNQPYEAWLAYSKEVETANKAFNTQNYEGYETDRGRVYLEYGRPSNIRGEAYEPGALPYEIWQYNRLGETQSNVKFVFYNPMMGGNNYRLLHSTAIGEMTNPHWRQVIYKEHIQDIDQMNIDNRGHFGSKIDEHFFD